MLGSPAVPPFGTGLDAVADIARRRAQGWMTFGQIFTTPTSAWVGEARSGEVRQRLEAAVGWRSGELQDYGPAMLTLGAFDRAARRRSVEWDVRWLTTAFTEMADRDDLEAAHGGCELLHQLCADESMAWTSGSLPRARRLRVRQDQELHGEAGDMLHRACAVIIDGARQPYQALGQLCRLWVDTERAGSSFADGS